MNLAWDCVRMKQQCSLLMQLEMNSFVQENTCIQNPWIVHAVSMKHTSAITRSRWDKPESQYKCVENVYQLCCVYACEYVYVFGWFIKDTSWMNESHTRGWLQASKYLMKSNTGHWPILGLFEGLRRGLLCSLFKHYIFINQTCTFEGLLRTLS